jgi:hypothetical protein
VGRFERAIVAAAHSGKGWWVIAGLILIGATGQRIAPGRFREDSTGSQAAHADGHAVQKVAAGDIAMHPQLFVITFGMVSGHRRSQVSSLICCEPDKAATAMAGYFFGAVE